MTNVVYDNGRWQLRLYTALEFFEVIHVHCNYVGTYDPNKEYFICASCGYYTRDDGLLCTALLLTTGLNQQPSVSVATRNILSNIYKTHIPKEEL
jgi:hypothetical protein